MKTLLKYNFLTPFNQRDSALPRNSGWEHMDIEYNIELMDVFSIRGLFCDEVTE